MSEEKIITEQELHTNPMLGMPVQPDTELKNILVEYVGTKLDKEEITVQMISEVLATDFPEFAFAFAEENFLRGYQLGINDAQGLHYPKAKTDAGTTD
jgi:CRISPR/Cas system CMR subunit Cmr6 (Cas7 group RAMP superfamily)